MSYIILSGGFIIWPIILLSIISLAIVIEKTWNLARDAVLPKDLTKDVISQIEKKVRWRECVEYLTNNGVKNFVEIGPGKVFTGMVKRTVKNVNCFSINSIDDIKKLKNEFNK